MHTCQIYIYSTNIPMLPFVLDVKRMLMLGTYKNCYIIFSYVIPFLFVYVVQIYSFLKLFLVVFNSL